MTFDGSNAPPIRGSGLEPDLFARTPGMASATSRSLRSSPRRLPRAHQRAHRRVPSHRLPFYEHGNDSGWDNWTAFDRTSTIESADLAAHLVL
jgi:hypothetical protein